MIDKITLKCCGAHRDTRKGVDYFEVVQGNRFYWMATDHHKWCVETFGNPGDFLSSDICRWYHNGSAFHFLNEEDCNWFLLRWS